MPWKGKANPELTSSSSLLYSFLLIQPVKGGSAFDSLQSIIFFPSTWIETSSFAFDVGVCWGGKYRMQDRSYERVEVSNLISAAAGEIALRMIQEIAYLVCDHHPLAFQSLTS